MSQAPASSPCRTIPTPRSASLNFRWFVASILAMAMGAQIQGVVVAWQMYAVTHDPLALGMVGLAEAAPFIAFALYAGHVADVRDRRRIALGALLRPVPLRRRAGGREPASSRRAATRAGWIRWTIYARDRRLRRRAQLPAAGAQRARRRSGAAPAVPERGRLAHRHLAGRGGHRSGAWAASSTPGSAPRRPTRSPRR